MPWQCNTCNSTIEQDDIACPGCKAPKTSWTLVPDATRTFVVSSRRIEVLRGGAAATEALAVSKTKAQGSPDQVLTVRLFPRGAADLTVTIGVGFVSKVFEERALPVEPPADLAADAPVDVPVLLVFGPGDAPALPGVHVVDVGEESESGFAPQIEVSALKKRAKELPVVGETEPKRAELLEIEDAHFHSGSAVLLPAFEGDVERVTGLGVLAAALEHVEENPGLKLLVTGHTDTTGSMAANVTLSQERAQSVRAALIGDREAWVGVADAHDKPRDHQAILAWVDRTFGWGCDPGPVDGQPGPKTRAGIEAFQRRHNEERGASISVDGIVGPQTLGAVFDCYEEDLADRLGMDASELGAARQRLVWVEPAAVGCGEHHPIDNARQDDYRSAQNRRVELLFFTEGEEPALACHAGGGCDPGACPIYDWVQYYTEAIPVVADSERPPSGPADPAAYFLNAVLFQRDLRERLGNAEVEVRGPLGTTLVSFTATSDEQGLVRSLDTLPAGIYEVEAGGQVGRAASVPYREELYAVWMERPAGLPERLHDGDDEAGEVDEA